MTVAGAFILQGFECPPPTKRQEWAQGADADGSLLVRDPLFDNREITVRLRVAQQTTMDDALTQISLLTKKLEEAEQQPDGLPLVWTPAGSTKSITFYVLSGVVDGLPISLTGDDAGWFLRSPVITLRLQCKPFGYGTPVTSSTTSSATPFVTATIASVPGDVPAEGRLLVTDAATQNRRYIEWGLEQRYFDPLTSLLVDSDDMVTSGYGGFQTTQGGAYDPNASGNNVIAGTLYAGPQAICATPGTLTHVGTYRVKARVLASAGGQYVRLAWQEGDGPFRSNSYASPPVSLDFCEVDLGLITIPPKQLGTQRWQGRIEAYTTAGAGSDTLEIDYLALVPAGEGYGRVRAADLSAAASLFSSGDDFESLGAGSGLNARTNLGGTWATSGATTDFAGVTPGLDGTAAVARSTTSDASPRYAVIGPSLTATDVSALMRISSGHVGATSGVIARWTNSSNYLVGYISYSLIGGIARPSAKVDKVVAGVTTTLGSDLLVGTGINLAAAFTLGLRVFTDGTWTLRLIQNGATIATFSGLDSALATGGAIASGQAGMRDSNTVVTACTRTYDDFSALVPPSPPIALYSGRTAEIRYDGAIRQDSTGTYYGPVPAYRGSRFLVPPAGDKNRTSRLLVKAHRNDIETAASSTVTDNLTIQTIITPRYCVVPF